MGYFERALATLVGSEGLSLIPLMSFSLSLFHPPENLKMLFAPLDTISSELNHWTIQPKYNLHYHLFCLDLRQMTLLECI